MHQYVVEFFDQSNRSGTDCRWTLQGVGNNVEANSTFSASLKKKQQSQEVNDDDALHVWLASEADFDLLTRFAEVLPIADWRSIDEHTFQPRRIQAIAARVLLRSALSSLTGWKIRPSDWEFGRTKEGKPYVLDAPEVSFSLSYSDHKIALAFSRRGAVAIDVEAGPIDLAKMDAYLSRRERMLISCHQEEERQSVLLRIWTLKEALVKLMGKGVSEDLSRIDTCQCILGKSNLLTLGAVEAVSHSIALDERETGGAPGWLSLAAVLPREARENSPIAGSQAPLPLAA